MPPGTGLFLARVILVSVPPPWPKPALNHAHLAPAIAHVSASTVPSRLFAAEPTSDTVTVEVFERHGAAAKFYRWNLDSAEQIEATVSAIALCDIGELVTARVPGPAAEQPAMGPVFLVCTQGSHDSCCGTSGVALADELETARPDVEVRRVSHTGGHRFSPTFLAFPEGRMWAFADLALIDRILSGSTTSRDHHQRSRGWWGAKVGPAQVAESAVRAELAGQPFVAPEIHPRNGADGRSATEFDVVVDDATWRVDVVVGRDIPTIACESPGGLPAKPGREFAWSIERR